MIAAAGINSNSKNNVAGNIRNHQSSRNGHRGCRHQMAVRRRRSVWISPRGDGIQITEGDMRKSDMRKRALTVSPHLLPYNKRGLVGREQTSSYIRIFSFLFRASHSKPRWGIVVLRQHHANTEVSACVRTRKSEITEELLTTNNVFSLCCITALVLRL